MRYRRKGGGVDALQVHGVPVDLEPVLVWLRGLEVSYTVSTISTDGSIGLSLDGYHFRAYPGDWVIHDDRWYVLEDDVFRALYEPTTDNERNSR